MTTLITPNSEEAVQNGIHTKDIHTSPPNDLIIKPKRRKKWWIIDPSKPPTADNLVTEDDTPVDGLYAEKQHRLLTQAVNDSYTGMGRPFIACTNVGLYYSPDYAPLVPDMMLSLDVTLPANIWEKRNRVYMIWEYGKPPEIIIEVVSNKRGGEETTRKRGAARAGVLYYVIYDPQRYLSQQVLRVYQLQGENYLEINEPWFPELMLGLVLWRGVYEGRVETWLRWCDQAGNLLLTGTEYAEQERQRAEQERQRAEQEQQIAEQERQRAEQAEEKAARLLAQLCELGVEPD